MKQYFKSLCILGTIVALGVWNCTSDDPNRAIPEENQSPIVVDPTIPDTIVVDPTTPDTIVVDPTIPDTIVVDPTIPDTTVPGIESSSSEIDLSSSSWTAISSSEPEPISSSEIQPESSSSEALSSSSSEIGSGSIGCGKSLGSIKTGYYKITSNGTSRDYAIDIPANYDPNKPYRLFYTSHWIGSKAADLVNGTVSPNGGANNWAFYGLKRVINNAGQQAIFIAPTAIDGRWGQVDHKLFDDLLSYAKTNLCVDTARVFAVGFSFGAMQTYSMSTNHQKDLRAVATLAAANWNIWLPTNTKQKIAYLGITGMSDNLCNFRKNDTAKQGGFYCAAEHATNNGCSVPTNIPTAAVGSKTHVVYDFKDCDPDYPVRYITFDGAHIAAPTDGQTSDDGLKTWAPNAMWDFFSQF